MYIKSISHKFILTEHGRFHTGEVPNNCDVCKKYLHRNLYWQSTWWFTLVKDHIIVMCGEMFCTDMYINRTHEGSHWRKGLYMWCVRRKFANKFIMTEHMKNWRFPWEIPYNCDVWKCSTHKCILTEHTRANTEEMPYNRTVFRTFILHRHVYWQNIGGFILGKYTIIVMCVEIKLHRKFYWQDTWDSNWWKKTYNCDLWGKDLHINVY